MTIFVPFAISLAASPVPMSSIGSPRKRMLRSAAGQRSSLHCLPHAGSTRRVSLHLLPPVAQHAGCGAAQRLRLPPRCCRCRYQPGYHSLDFPVIPAGACPQVRALAVDPRVRAAALVCNVRNGVLARPSALSRMSGGSRSRRSERSSEDTV
jgi:hypothetical protein